MASASECAAVDGVSSIRTSRGINSGGEVGAAVCVHSTRARHSMTPRCSRSSVCGSACRRNREVLKTCLV